MQSASASLNQMSLIDQKCITSHNHLEIYIYLLYIGHAKMDGMKKRRKMLNVIIFFDNNFFLFIFISITELID
jgi:hypothetical protein